MGFCGREAKTLDPRDWLCPLREAVSSLIIKRPCEGNIRNDLFPGVLLTTRFTITEKIPFPARSVLSVVMTALKVKRPAAEKLIHSGHVLLDGRPLTKSHTLLDVGDTIEIAPFLESESNRKLIPASRVPFGVLHNDPYLIVVNKPAGLLTVPTPSRESTTLQSQLQKWLKGQREKGDAICVHRLDKPVSGVLVFAKTPEVADQLRDQFAARKPERVYRAFVRGTPREQSGTIESYLSTDEDLNRRSSDDPDSGELAITHYQLETSWANISLLALRLETGRRHQIRVHLSDLGHPILGDARYSAEAADDRWPFVRIALHAETLGFQHPVTKHTLRLVAPWPPEFRELRRQLNGQR
jgi:23S rRNA pseudouridine1911/1915/1917 synthase